jgi:hypothetical protein
MALMHSCRWPSTVIVEASSSWRPPILLTRMM